jgi:quinol monooxygenase YgiN
VSTRVVVPMQALPGKSDEFARLFNETAAQVRKEPGCEQYELFRSTTSPDGFVLLERWRDRAALDTHIALIKASPPAPHGALRAGPPAVEIYEA